MDNTLKTFILQGFKSIFLLKYQILKFYQTRDNSQILENLIFRNIFLNNY